jgi:hypothetical protein
MQKDRLIRRNFMTGLGVLAAAGGPGAAAQIVSLLATSSPLPPVPERILGIHCAAVSG